MSGWQSSRPPWETQGQPALPADETWYGEHQGPRVIIKPQETSAGGTQPPRYTESPGKGNRTRTLIGVLVGLAAAAGIAAAAVEFTHVTWGQSAAAPSIPAAVPSTSPAATAAALAPAPAPAPTESTTASGYTLTAPATAGGYTRTSPMSATVKAIGTAGATELMTAVEASGGKPASNVSGQYLIPGDQALGYAGYTGTFSPAAVLAAFKMGASNVMTEAAGPHGGVMACGEVSVTSPTATNWTACVWATTTTVGMVEFYGSGGAALETVLPAKAGADTAKFRASVEATK